MLLGSSCEYLHKQPICDLVARAAQFAEHNCTKPVSAWRRCCYFHILLKVEVFLNILSLQLTSPSSQQERYKNLNFLVQVILKKTMKMQIDEIQKFTNKFPIFHLLAIYGTLWLAIIDNKVLAVGRQLNYIEYVISWKLRLCVNV